MATWARLLHDECKLPTMEEVEKAHAKTGSVVKCGDSATGCPRLWGLSMDQGKECWREVTVVQPEKAETSYCGTERYVPVSGSDYAASLAEEQRERERAERQRELLEARAAYYDTGQGINL